MSVFKNAMLALLWCVLIAGMFGLAIIFAL